MRKILSILAASLAFMALGSAHALSVTAVRAVSGDDVDTQIVDAEVAQAAPTADDFTMKQFSSCSQFQDVVKTYLSGAFLRYGQGWYGRPYYRGGPVMMEDGIMGGVRSTMDKEVSAPSVGATEATSGKSASDFSQTNVQVAGVDEGETVKSDGKNLYYFNETDHLVYIVKAFPANAMTVLKKIKLPTSFSNPELYVADGRLTIVATKWVQDVTGGKYWVDRSTKTVVVVYGLADPSHPQLQRYSQIDGSYARSRRVGDRLYVLSQSSLTVPYNRYVLQYYSDTGYHADASNFAKDLASLSPADVLPRKTEIRLVPQGQGNVTVGGKAVPYSATSSAATDCKAVEYILPDEATIKKFNADPQFVSVTTIDLADASAAAKSKVIFGNLSEIYLGQGELFLTSHQYRSQPWNCPQGAYCHIPYFQSTENTLLHKFTVQGDAVTYKASAVLPGAPLNQYSMDSDKGYFRIVTKGNYPERQTSVFVLDSDLKKAGSITGIAKGEDFKSARFLGDRLYLVTFQQIDPLFTISLADPKNPTILGELKIPGFSTYLHPYDATTLIGLGYGTKVNQWGGTQTAGLKVDLYDVSDVKNPKQMYTVDLGEQGSNSEALNNPRLFVWNPTRKLLFLPVTLYLKKDATSYENKDAFQGVEVVSIDKAKGISRVAEMTHISTDGLHEDRLAACKQYMAPVDSKPACRKLLDGTTVCTDPATQNRWVPEYCYADATDGAYFASQMWNWQRDFVKRTAFMDNFAYSLADSGIKAWDIDRDFALKSSVDFDKQ